MLERGGSVDHLLNECFLLCLQSVVFFHVENELFLVQSLQVGGPLVGGDHGQELPPQLANLLPQSSLNFCELVILRPARLED